MDKQRMLRFPPNPECEHLHNPFAKLPPYRYSQSAFKSFTEAEIRNQAGIESIPSTSSRREEDQDKDGDDRIDPDVVSQVGGRASVS
jgi:hypothetical protein